MGFAAEQINHADKIVFNANWQHHHQRICPQNVFYLTDYAQEVCANAVQFVDENNAGDLRVVGVAPVRFGLRFHAARAAKDADAAVQNLKGTIDFNGKVNVPRGVNDVETMIVPETGGRSRLNGDSALFFLIHEIRGGFAVMNLTCFVDFTGQFENTLRSCGLAGIYVGENTYISVE